MGRTRAGLDRSGKKGGTEHSRRKNVPEGTDMGMIRLPAVKMTPGRETVVGR